MHYRGLVQPTTKSSMSSMDNVPRAWNLVTRYLPKTRQAAWPPHKERAATESAPPTLAAGFSGHATPPTVRHSVGTLVGERVLSYSM